MSAVPDPAAKITKPLLRVLDGEVLEHPPIWIMRQAGRYLPEYREIRKQVGGFLELCYTPELAAEVTLQPLRRFPLDAAILFSDILVIPDALGQAVRFAEGEGPVLDPLTPETVERLEPGRARAHLAPVLETVRRVRAGLAGDKTLLGFCGSPWTVATYMLGGRGSSDQAAARLFALQHPEAFARLIDILVDASVEYLIAQLEAGADAVQLFESWAMNLDASQFEERVIAPNRRIVERVRAAVPQARIIGFPRGAAAMIPGYAAAVGVNAVGLDYSTPPAWANAVLPKGLAVQGNLDPLRVVAGGQQMEDAARRVLEGFAGRPHIFNLGHGIVPQTPIGHVERLVALVKGS